MCVKAILSITTDLPIQVSAKIGSDVLLECSLHNPTWILDNSIIAYRNSNSSFAKNAEKAKLVMKSDNQYYLWLQNITVLDEDKYCCLEGEKNILKECIILSVTGILTVYKNMWYP